ncbi:small ribosomal subunit protein eS8-like [Dasypus novemcinctus]|uniref:small ribosomal subunit protein eS8-like n=1 Tax=Dasypus novemcinctus TaxID=9361 RepID=UPI0039C9E961
MGNFWGSERCTRQTGVISAVYRAAATELAHQGPGENGLALTRRTAPRAVRVPLCSAPGQADFLRRKRFFNKKQPKKSQKKYMKGKRRPRSAVFSRSSSSRARSGARGVEAGPWGRAGGCVLQGKELEF